VVKSYPLGELHVVLDHLNIRRARVWKSEDGFEIVWLELGPLKPPLAHRLLPARSRVPAG